MHRVGNNTKSLKITKIRNFANNKQKKILNANILLLHNLCNNFCGKSINVNKKTIKTINASDDIISKQLRRIFIPTNLFVKINFNIVVLPALNTV